MKEISSHIKDFPRFDDKKRGIHAVQEREYTITLDDLVLFRSKRYNGGDKSFLDDLNRDVKRYDAEWDTGTLTTECNGHSVTISADDDTKNWKIGIEDIGESVWDYDTWTLSEAIYEALEDEPIAHDRIADIDCLRSGLNGDFRSFAMAQTIAERYNTEVRLFVKDSTGRWRNERWVTEPIITEPDDADYEWVARAEHADMLITRPSEIRDIILEKLQSADDNDDEKWLELADFYREVVETCQDLHENQMVAVRYTDELEAWRVPCERVCGHYDCKEWTLAVVMPESEEDEDNE